MKKFVMSKSEYDLFQEQFEELQKKQISHSLENWDYTLLHTSNLTKKQKKNRAKINQQNNQEK